MIIRSILTAPDDYLANFDWFNDYEDTRSFLCGVENDNNKETIRRIVDRLDAGHADWLKRVSLARTAPLSPSTAQGIETIANTMSRFLDADTITNVIAVCRPVLEDPRFHSWPASIPGKDGKPKHHGEEGGLFRHVNEVMGFALGASSAFPYASDMTGRIDREKLAIGVIWHDSGKMAEYEKKDGEWVRATPLVSHIMHGLQLWGSFCGKHCFPQELFPAVQHLIASHHGRREWGSPVVPSNIEAMILHSADMMSVMLDGGDNPAARL